MKIKIFSIVAVVLFMSASLTASTKTIEFDQIQFTQPKTQEIINELALLDSSLKITKQNVIVLNCVDIALAYYDAAIDSGYTYEQAQQIGYAAGNLCAALEMISEALN